MKLFRIGLGAICLAASIFAAPVHAATSHSGSFYNPAQDGHGFVFEELENGLIVVYWYTYRADGTSTFLLGVLSGKDGSYSGDLIQTEGMVFGDFDPGTNEQFTWGTFSVDFNDCASADVSWDPSVEGYTSGSTTISRLTRLHGVNCSENMVQSNYAISVTSIDGILRGSMVFMDNGTVSYTLGDHMANSWAGFGTWEESGDGFDFDSEYYANNGTDALPLSGSAGMTPDGFITVTDQASQIVATRTDGTQTDTSQGSLEGTFAMVSGGFNLGTASISSNGTFEGDIFGCKMNGTAKVLHNNFNQVEVDILTSGSCPAGDGRMQGAATVDPDGHLDVFVVDTVVGQGYVLKLERQ